MDYVAQGQGHWGSIAAVNAESFRLLPFQLAMPLDPSPEDRGCPLLLWVETNS